MGDTSCHTSHRRRATRQHPDFIPWTDEKFIKYFNFLKENEARPSAIEGMWLSGLFVEKHAGTTIEVAGSGPVIRAKDPILEDMETVDCFDNGQASPLLF